MQNQARAARIPGVARVMVAQRIIALPGLAVIIAVIEPPRFASGQQATMGVADDAMDADVDEASEVDD